MARSSKLRAQSAKDAGTAEPDSIAPNARLAPVDLTANAPPGTAIGPGQPALAATLDAAGRVALLRREFEAAPDTGDKTDDAKAPAAPPASTSTARKGVLGRYGRLIKTIAGLLVAIIVGWAPVRALLETTSTEAVINARLITLRAPIEGEVGPLLGSLSVGRELEPGVTLMQVVNRRADRIRLDDVRRLIDQLDGQRSALMVRLDHLKSLRGDLEAQTRAFLAGRIRQLEARTGELASEIAAADASREEAMRALERARPLAETGTMSQAVFEKARRDAAVTAATHAALRHRLTGIEVELDGARQGVFIGDSYNDRPSSSQRVDEIAQRIGEVGAEIRERELRLANLRTELVEETRRFAEVAAARLISPVRASVWEVLTAPGEAVARGQDLVRLLDCAGTVVTATVGETIYNQLRIGDPARFRLRGEQKEHTGRIVGLTGVAAAPANLAIQPSALAKEPYRVTVALPDLAASGQCDVGRTGRVTFGK